MDPSYPLVPVLNLVCCVLVLITVSTVIRQSWNTGVCLFGAWIFISTLTSGVNEIVWHDNIRNVAPVWCDICMSPFACPFLLVLTAGEASHLEIGAIVAIPACSLIITRRLARIGHVRPVTGKQERVGAERIPSVCLHDTYRLPQDRIDLAIELSIGVGLPFLVMALCMFPRLNYSHQ